jgi:hypothetical protein
MNTTPSGSMNTAKALRAPLPVAASASGPSGATITASVKPTTDCAARPRIIGHASAIKARTVGSRQWVASMVLGGGTIPAIALPRRAP